MNLAEALIAALNDPNHPNHTIIPEHQRVQVQVVPAMHPKEAMRILRHASMRYADGCPFKAGDFITARADSGIPAAGFPAVVLEVCAPKDGPHNDITTKHTEPGFGARLDMRIAGIEEDGSVGAWWTESWMWRLLTTEDVVQPPAPPSPVPPSPFAA